MFTQPADHEGDEFHPLALKQSFAAENSGSVKRAALTLLDCLLLSSFVVFQFFPLLRTLSVFFIQLFRLPFAYHAEVTTDQTMNNGEKTPINRLQTRAWLRFQKYVIHCTWVLNVSQMRGVHVLFRLCCLHPKICAMSSKIVLSHIRFPTRRTFL